MARRARQLRGERDGAAAVFATLGELRDALDGLLGAD